ncbi:hypothetical protein EPO04_01315 [Patescibacteria group bacterium]|nr:MAG: hypothetical protein EPO04_01315 [Patescibacteria group bacterium]
MADSSTYVLLAGDPDKVVFPAASSPTLYGLLTSVARQLVETGSVTGDLKLMAQTADGSYRELNIDEAGEWHRLLEQLQRVAYNTELFPRNSSVGLPGRLEIAA